MNETVRFASFRLGEKTSYGAVRGDGIVDLGQRFGDRWQSLQAVVEAGRLSELERLADGFEPDLAVASVGFLPPIARPDKIICVGVNYPDRNEEYKDGQAPPQYPSLFVRFPQSFVGHEAGLVRPKVSEQLDYEGEIALVIGRPGRHIAEADALAHVAALTLCNEGSVRDFIRHGKFNVTQGKNFDRSGAMGPWLVPFTGEQQVADIRLTTRVNGELRQDDRTARMIFPVRRLIAYISSFSTLQPGDIIVTGTPTGAGARLDPPRWLKPGDIVEVEAEGLGILRNAVVDES